MNSQQRYFWDDSLQNPQEEQKISDDVQNILDLFSILKIEDKILAKKLIKTINIF